jgi:hypothetical protein
LKVKPIASRGKFRTKITSWALADAGREITPAAVEALAAVLLRTSQTVVGRRAIAIAVRVEAVPHVAAVVFTCLGLVRYLCDHETPEGPLSGIVRRRRVCAVVRRHTCLFLGLERVKALPDRGVAHVALNKLGLVRAIPAELLVPDNAVNELSMRGGWVSELEKFVGKLGVECWEKW